MLFSLFYGFMAATGGGYITALVARDRELAHAMALAGLSVLLSLVNMYTAAGKEPIWYQVSNMVLVVPAVLLGGYLRRVRVR